MVLSLPCSEDTQAILAGYIVQGEFGDFDPSDHTPGYLDDFPFVLGKVRCSLGWCTMHIRTRAETVHYVCVVALECLVVPHSSGQ